MFSDVIRRMKKLWEKTQKSECGNAISTAPDPLSLITGRLLAAPLHLAREE